MHGRVTGTVFVFQSSNAKICKKNAKWYNAVKSVTNAPSSQIVKNIMINTVEPVHHISLIVALGVLTNFWGGATIKIFKNVKFY